jgi:hypothetical protein
MRVGRGRPEHFLVGIDMAQKQISAGLTAGAAKG